jgi:esterase/lipase superfamily enzyme
VKQVTEEPASEFFARVAKRTANSQQKEALVFVHGFNTTFQDAVRRTAQIAYDLGFDGPAITYSWPSQGSIGVVSYNKDVRNAELTADHFQHFLQDLRTQSGATTIHLIAHSMGNRPLTAALKQFARNSGPDSHTHFNQVVLMAPDIDAAQFKQLANEIQKSATRITLYASSKDEALKLSTVYAGYPRAGQGGDDIVVVPGIDTVDASLVDTSLIGFSHQYYADNGTVLSDLFYVLKGNSIGKRFGLMQRQSRDGPYWLLEAAAH